MRIIAGVHRGRKLERPSSFLTRPTADRTRETLFNLLSHEGMLVEAVVLDAFSGTGAFGLEALSRGAQEAIFWDIRYDALQVIEHNILTLHEEARSQAQKQDALKPPKAPKPMDLIFLDPPYSKGLIEKCLTALKAQKWIKNGTVIAIERGAKEEILLESSFSLIKERISGAAKLSLYVCS